MYVTKKMLLDDMKNIGIKAGDTVFVQSALRPIGEVEGGAAAVVSALRETVGEEGTVVAPAFCFIHEIQNPPIIDPKNDVSEMGRISEAVRKCEGATRSIAYRHSVSAVGKNASLVTDVDSYISPFDIRSSFGRMLGLDAKVLLLGVPYLNSTSHHFTEYVLSVPDREVVPMAAKLRDENGNLSDITVCDYRPKANPNGEYYSYPHDFNRSGRLLEKEGLVTVSHIGNAVTRVFRMRDLVHYFVDHYSIEYNLFAELDGKTVLPDGVEVTAWYKDGADRDDLAVWCCLDPDEIYKVNGEITPVSTFPKE